MRSISGLSLPATALAMVLSLALVGSACGKVNQLKGAKAYKAANAAYQTQDYKKAADLYQETVTADPDFPDFAPAYFFLGNSLDNLWKPSKKGDPENDKLLEDAVKNYQLAADKLGASENPEYKKYGKLALQYLVAAYGSEKLNDAGKAEPILQHMIQLEPGDPANYFMLARLYDDAGVPDEAERMYIAAKDARPNDPAVYMSLAAHYNQLGQFDKTIAALEAARRERTRQPGGVPDDRELLLGQGEQGLAPARRREEGLRPQGHRVGRSRAADQAGLRRGHGLQGPPAAAAGEPRKGPGQAAAPDQGSRRAARQGRGYPQEEGHRGLAPSPLRLFG